MAARVKIDDAEKLKQKGYQVVQNAEHTMVLHHGKLLYAIKEFDDCVEIKAKDQQVMLKNSEENKKFTVDQVEIAVAVNKLLLTCHNGDSQIWGDEEFVWSK